MADAIADARRNLERERDNLKEQVESLDVAIKALGGAQSPRRSASSAPTSSNGRKRASSNGRKRGRGRSKGTGVTVDTEILLEALQRAQAPVGAQRLRELAGLPDTITSTQLREGLAELINTGKVKKSGEARATTYQIV